MSSSSEVTASCSGITASSSSGVTASSSSLSLQQESEIPDIQSPPFANDTTILNQLLEHTRHHQWTQLQQGLPSLLLTTSEERSPLYYILWAMVTDPTLLITTPVEEDPNYLGWRWVLTQSQLDLNTKDDQGETALFKASMMGLSRIVIQLLESGADPSISDHMGRTPLSVASAAGHVVTCLKLMKMGHADPNLTTTQQPLAPLCLATIEGHVEVVRILLSNPQIKVNITDQFGWTSLMLAGYLGHAEIIELLLAAGVNRFIKDPHHHKTAMELAHDNGHLRLARRLQTYKEIEQPSLDLTKVEMLSDQDEIGWANVPTKISKGLLGGGEVPDDISLDSDDQMEIQRKLDRQDTLDTRSSRSHSTLSSLTSPFTNTLRSRRVRHGTLKNHLRNTWKGRARLTDIALTELDGRPLLQPDQPLSNLSAQPPEKPRLLLDSQSRWELFSKLITICCLPGMLNVIGRMKDRSVQQAWREKVALCFIIAVISGGLGFLSFGFSAMVCQKVIPIFPDQLVRQYGPRAEGMKLMSVRGQLYDTGSFFPVGNHRPILPFLDEDLQPIVDAFYGGDISIFFPPDRHTSLCKFWPTYEGGSDDACKKLGKNPKMHCHTSQDAWDKLRGLSINNYVAFSWQNISNSGDKYFVFNERVFSLTEYLDSNNKDRYFGSDLDPILAGFVGRDATKDILRHPKLTSLIPCFEDQMLVGRLDGTTIGCFASNLVMIIATAILLTITVVKFAAAMLFDWFLSWKLGKISTKHRPKSSLAYIMLLVTCYSEGEDSLRTTLDSLAHSDYDDEHKLLFVIADGDVTGSGNAKSTPDLLLDMLEPLYMSGKRSNNAPKPRMYISIGDGAKQTNMARVHMGHYIAGDRRVPFLLVVKCGVPNERTMPKAGNRGKRDSQLILMRWLSAICFNEKMTPLDYDLSEKVRVLCGVTPDKYEMILMVDADTKVMPDAVSRMVAAMERDPTIMGLCGETKITNKRDSWVTMIQVYEYYISHHLGKAFESIFGGVTCLPGCFCMYRIKVPKSDGYSVPILANPDIVANYASNDVSTLHKKNLLLLGEDRYLTTLMLRAFPKRKMIYVPKAICKTVVPDEFAVLLSQRRRWINSTVHNLLELVLVPQLCGIFCCSMQFVIFLELVGTVVMPASLLFLLYLIVGSFLGQDVMLPLLFMAALFLLQAVLIVLTTRKFSYIAWMLIYILALPVWNFVLPAYSFWRFDDFSWGATRKINGPDDGHAHAGAGGPTKPIPRKRWSEWQQLGIEKRTRREVQRQLREQAKADQLRINKQQALMDKQREHFQNHTNHLEKLRAFQAAPLKTSPSTRPMALPWQPVESQPSPNGYTNHQNHVVSSSQEDNYPQYDAAIPNRPPRRLHDPKLYPTQVQISGELIASRSNSPPTRPLATVAQLYQSNQNTDLDFTSLRKPRGPRPTQPMITAPISSVVHQGVPISAIITTSNSSLTSPTLLRNLIDPESPPSRTHTLPRGPRQDTMNAYTLPTISSESDDDSTNHYLTVAELEVDHLINHSPPPPNPRGPRPPTNY